MLRNYIQLALTVMGRRKFFTFISLFGISFTLAILMLIVAFLQSELGSHPPISKGDKIVLMPTLSIMKEYFDTIPQYDTSWAAGQMAIDTTYEYSSAGQSISTSAMSRSIIQNHFLNLPSADKVAYATAYTSLVVYHNGQKFDVNISYTSPEYWDIFDYNLLEGRFLNASDNSSNSPNIVITDELAEEYFGQKSELLGKTIELDGQDYAVVGVIEKARLNSPLFNHDAYITESRLVESDVDSYYFGSFYLLALGDAQATKKDIEYAASKIPMKNPEEYDKTEVKPMSYRESFASFSNINREPEKAYRIMWMILAAVISFFTLLPLLNLVNLNVSRIMDRSSEIGVRKAFGATNSHILWQYIFENIIQTIVGGFIGLLLALAAIYLINTSDLLGNTHLVLSPAFFAMALLITLIFGLLSGIIPAYKTSKSHIVQSLKSTQL